MTKERVKVAPEKLELKPQPPAKRGRGRPRGAINHQSMEWIKDAIRSGSLPHAVLYKWAFTGYMTYERGLDGMSKTAVEVALPPELRVDAMFKAANYYAAKITGQQGQVGNLIEAELVRVNEWAIAEFRQPLNIKVIGGPNNQ